MSRPSNYLKNVWSLIHRRYQCFICTKEGFLSENPDVDCRKRIIDQWLFHNIRWRHPMDR